MENWHAIAVVTLLIVFFAILPPEYDPAIRLKEWMEKKSDKRDKEN